MTDLASWTKCSSSDPPINRPHPIHILHIFQWYTIAISPDTILREVLDTALTKLQILADETPLVHLLNKHRVRVRSKPSLSEIRLFIEHLLVELDIGTYFGEVFAAEHECYLVVGVFDAFENEVENLCW